MTLVSSILADRADKTFAFAAGINTDEIEDLSLMEFTFVALKISYSELFYLFGLNAHQLIIRIQPMYSDRHSYRHKTFTHLKKV